MVKLNVKVMDDGYGDTKYVGNDDAPHHISSHVTSFKPNPSNEFSLNNNKDKTIYIASEVNGEKYTIGDYAAKLDPQIKWIGGENKHADDRFPILAKTILGMMNTESFEVIDMLAMNLPIRYDTQERRELLTNIIKGDHDLRISYDGINFHNRSIHVKDVLIKKQSFGSFCYKILNEQGGIKDEKLAAGFNVVVDIGARTLNILTIDAMKEQPALTDHTNDGMFEAYFKIAEVLHDKYGIIIPDGKLPQVIEKGEIKGIDIKPLIDMAFKDHANNIISLLDKTFIHSWSFITSLIITGGGAEILKPYLLQAFEQRNVQKIFLNRYANAQGLRWFALRQVMKNEKSKRVSVKIGR
ncbi:ParM/StbA family protein [Aquibacillus saliphilus]|uniref:ParM/StbA family protein n=1 Tax=Aquibacillus saliphilus TaxID=1909422 RepID=UPI001CF0937D|nr:ParM/StbA family protein [Aquibacillus saliphilus]